LILIDEQRRRIQWRRWFSLVLAQLGDRLLFSLCTVRSAFAVEVRGRFCGQKAKPA
jgi:hypothetical protein